MQTINTARAVGNVFLVMVTIWGISAFLSSLFLVPLSAYRNEVLQHHGATYFYDVIRLRRRGQVSKNTLLFNAFLLGVHLCLGIGILLTLCTAFSFPFVLVCLALGGLGGLCITHLSSVYFTTASWVFMDKIVFASVYTCCFLFCGHLLLASPVNWLLAYKHLCIGITLGCFVKVALASSVERWVVSTLFVFCSACSYMMYSVVRLGLDLHPDVVIVLCLNVCLGLFVGRGMVVRTNLFTAAVSFTFGWVVWLSFSYSIFFNGKTFASAALMIKMEILCVEIGHFCVLWLCTRKFILERGSPDTYLIDFAALAGIARFNYVICRLMQLV